MARCRHCNKFLFINRSSGLCRGCENYLNAERIRHAAEAESQRRAEEERMIREAEEARKAEEERRIAEEAELLRRAEEERMIREAEEARKAEEERRIAEEAELLRRAEEERMIREAEEAKKAEEERRIAEEAELLRRAEEERMIREAEEARKVEEERRIAEEAELLRRAEEERMIREAEEARKAEEERRIAEEAELLRRAEEERMIREAEEAKKAEEERRLAEEAQRIKWLQELQIDTEEYLRLESSNGNYLEKNIQKGVEKEQHSAITEDLRKETEEIPLMAQKFRQEKEINRLQNVTSRAKKEQVERYNDPCVENGEKKGEAKYIDRKQIEHLLFEALKNNHEVHIAFRNDFTTIRRRFWEREGVWLTTLRVYYQKNALFVAVAKNAPEISIAEQQILEGTAFIDQNNESISLNSETWLLLRIRNEKIHLFFSALLQMEIQYVNSIFQKYDAIWQDQNEEDRGNHIESASESQLPDKYRNESIIELHLSKRIYNCLWNEGICTLDALYKLSEKDLLSIKSLGQMAVGEILHRRKAWLEQVTALEKNNAPMEADEKWAFEEENLLVANDTVQDEHDAFVEEQGEQEAQPMIPEMIQEPTSNDENEKIPEQDDAHEEDTPIVFSPENTEDKAVDVLLLSNRANNSLKRNGIYTLRDLYALSEEDLNQFKALGKTTVAEILRRRKEYINEATGEKKQEKETDKTILDNAADISLSELNLSKRAFNGLYQAGIRTLGELYKLSEEELYSIKNLGKIAVGEILNCRNVWLEQTATLERFKALQAEKRKAATIQCPEKGENISISRLGLSVRGYNALIRKGINTLGELCKLTEAELAATERLGQLTVKEILACRENWVKRLENGDIDGEADENDPLQTDENQKKTVLSPIPFQEYIDSLQDERIKFIISQRCKGKTLQDIAVPLELTRERVRQHEQKFWRRLSFSEISFHEDRYIPLLDKYILTKTEFQAILNESNETWYIACNRSKLRDEATLPIEEAVYDEELSAEIRTAIRNFLQTLEEETYVWINGEQILAERASIEYFVLSKYCREGMLIDEFIDQYNSVLTEAGYNEERFLITENNRKTRENALYEHAHVLCSFGKKIRYYPLEQYDIPAFIDALQLELFQDIEISSRKLLLDYPEIMEAYDIRNEYELHNLLRKQKADMHIPGMAFGKMPMISFGNTNRVDFILDMLFELAPISKADFAAAVSEKTGLAPELALAKAEYSNAMDVYLHDNMLTIDSEEMPEYEKTALLGCLDEDCYTLEEIKRIYKRATGNSDMRLLSPYNLKRMGFKVYSSYIIRNFQSAIAYFRHILTNAEIVDYSSYAKRFGNISEWSEMLNRLKDSYEIIEFSPYQLVRKDRLERFGVTQDHLRGFCEEVYRFTEPDQHFTIYSLKKAGFDSSLFNLGFDDWFYSSVLREDKRFGNVRLRYLQHDTLLFRRDVPVVSRKSFIEYLLEGGSMDLDELFARIEEDYAAFLDKQDITVIIADSELYYDATMRKLYANKELYYDEV